MPRTAPDRPLRVALSANAVFSGLTGAALVGDLGGLAARLALPFALTATLGVGLLLFAAGVARVSRYPNPSRVLWISAADLIWVAGTAALLWMHPVGAGLVTGSSAVVAALAAAQLAAVRSSLREVRPGLGAWRHTVVVDADASPAALWCVVRDAGAIARFMPELATSELRDGVAPATGAVRACSDHAGARWAEQIIRLDDEDRSFDVRFLDHELGFPFPARPMFGGWRVCARAGGGSRVEVWWSLTPTVAWAPWLVVALMGLRVDGGIQRAVARMDAAVTGGVVPTGRHLGVVPC